MDIYNNVYDLYKWKLHHRVINNIDDRVIITKYRFTRIMKKDEVVHILNHHNLDILTVFDESITDMRYFYDDLVNVYVYVNKSNMGYLSHHFNIPSLIRHYNFDMKFISDERDTLGITIDIDVSEYYDTYDKAMKIADDSLYDIEEFNDNVMRD